MFTVNAAKVRALVIERGLSVKEFATQAKLNALTAKKALTDGAKLNLKVVGTLAKFFGVDNADELLLKE